MKLSKIVIIRFIIVFVVLGILSGGIWLLLRQNPGEKVTALRAKVMQLMNSDDPVEWAKVTSRFERAGKDLEDIQVRAEIARKASETIIEIYPKSQIDLMNRGAVEEFAGNLHLALEWYDKVAAMEHPSPLVELNRARVLRKLRFYEEAKGAVSSVIDVFPFESNLELGKLLLETFQPVEAYQSFKRAESHGDKGEELRQVYEGMMNALELMVTTTRSRLEQVRRNQGPKDRIRGLEARVAQLNESYQHALDETIKYWRRADPRTREHFAAVQLKIVELINKKEGIDNLKESQKVLSEAVIDDRGHRDFPIYLLLATVNLNLAYNSPNTEPSKIAYYVKKAESNFSKAFLFDVEKTSVEFEYLRDWQLPKKLSQETFDAHMTSRACQILLHFPEFWRILSDKHINGQADPLEIHQRLTLALDSDKVEDTLHRELKINRTLAYLKKGDLDLYRTASSQLLDAAPEEDILKLAIQIAQGIASFAPDRGNTLIELVDKYILNRLKSLASSSLEYNLPTTRSVIKILDQTRRHLLRNQARERDASANQATPRTEVAHRLGEKMREIIAAIPESTTEPDRYILASNLMTTFVGLDGAIEILQQGKTSFPNEFSIPFALGELFMAKANDSRERNRWDNYTKALHEFLSIYVVKPYITRVLYNLAAIGTQYGTEHQDKWTRDLTTVVTDLFPESSPTEVRRLVDVLGAILKQDFGTAITKVPKADEAKTVRPFLNLIAGVSYLQETNRILQKGRLENPVTAVASRPEQFEGQLKELYKNARQEFENGLSIDSLYLPIHIDMIKIKINETQPGKEISESFLDQIRTFRDQHPQVYQFHYLLAIALKKQREHLITQGKKLSKLSELLLEERFSLRKAIQGNPSYTDAYVALAETYVISWRLYFTPLRKYKKTYKKLGSPEFDVAIPILERASPTPKVLDLLASYHEADKNYEKAINYQKALLYQYPSWTRVVKIIDCYITLRNFEGARLWLNSPGQLPFSDKEIELDRLTLLAMLDTLEANSPGIPDERLQFLRNRQLKNYRLVVEKAKELGKDPPLEAVNNLAFLLTELGEPEEGRRVLDPVISRLDVLKDSLNPQQLEGIEDTYARILHKTGELAEAAKIFKRLCSSETNQETHQAYAQLLFDQKRFAQALKQLDIILNSKNQSPKIENEARRLKEQINALTKK